GGVDAVLELQLEVGRLAAAPDDEGVFLQRVLGGRLADDCGVLDAPEFRVAVPALQARSIEDRHKARVIVERPGLRTAAAPAATARLLRSRLARHARGDDQSNDRGIPRQHVRTLSHCLDRDDARTASVTESVASPSRNVGGAGFPPAA